MPEHVSRPIRRDPERPSPAQWIAEQRFDRPRLDVDVVRVLDDIRSEHDVT